MIRQNRNRTTYAGRESRKNDLLILRTKTMKIIESGFYLLVFIIMIPIAVAYGKTIEIILYIYYLSDSEIHAVRKRDKQYFKKLKKRSRLLGDMSTYKEERRFERLYKRKCAWHLTKEDIAWKRRIPD